jgi:Guanosine polyphosphate pyrophosphohydrolases/synthetases
VLIINNHEIILKSQKYIENHLEEKLFVSEIAQEYGYSEYYFSRMFSEDTGISVMEYVKRRRLIRAAKEIADGMKIIDAAFKYSYDSHSGFTKAFKKEFGYTPSLLSACKMQMDDLKGGNHPMSKLMVKQTRAYVTKEKLFHILQECIQDNNIKCDMENISKAYEISKKAYGDLKRYSGEEYIIHPLNVAIILADIGAGENVIIAGLMCDLLDKTDWDVKELDGIFPTEVKTILTGASTFFIAKGQDSDEIVLVKLAERLHNMRTLRAMDESQWKIKAKETVEIYMPLARKFGNNAIVEELHKLAIEYM